MDPVPGDDHHDAIVVTTRNRRGSPGDAGIWLVARLGPLTLPIKLPLCESIHVWTSSMPYAPPDLVRMSGIDSPAPVTCIARHTLCIFYIHYLTLDYVITPA